MNRILKSGALVLCAISLLTFCKKDDPNAYLNEAGSSYARQTGQYTRFVKYNARYDVLEFTSWNDVIALEKALDAAALQYPYDQGNTRAIYQMFQDIRTKGFTNGNANGNNKKVKLSDLKQLLENSKPLSDQTLLDLVALHNDVGMTPSVMQDILSSHVPFSYEVLTAVERMNLPTAHLRAVIQKDDDEVGVANLVYEDFLREVSGFNSLWKCIEIAQDQKLANGMDPGDPGFDDEFVGGSFERLILNKDHEVYIEGTLYKLYDSCKAVLFGDGIANAYQGVDMLDPAGNPNIPGGQGEDSLGVDISQFIPDGFMIYNPQIHDPLGGPNDDPNWETALQELNTGPECPKSNFFFSSYDLNDFSAQFWQDADFGDYPGTPIQYWNFGDGTGSFQENPVHSFPGYGTYLVRLTTFTPDCGCWHVHTMKVVINKQFYQGKNPACPITNLIADVNPADGSVFLTSESGEPWLEDNFVTAWKWKIYNVDPNSSGGATPIHTHESGMLNQYNYSSPAPGAYWVEVCAFWQDGCVAEYGVIPFYVPAPDEHPGCCDKIVREKDVTYHAIVGGDQYKLKIKDKSRGTFGTAGWRRIGGWHKLYKKNGSGKWKKFKTHHKRDDYGQYFKLDKPEYECSVPTSHLKFYRSCGGSADWKFEKWATGFDKRFGLKEKTIVLEHTVYLGGTWDLMPSGPCEMSGGNAIFDEVKIELGSCN